MKTLYQSLLLAIGALALAGTAFAQVPSTNDTSDTNDNTGMGTGALGGPAALSSGVNNTASGSLALHANTTGSANTASGEGALASNKVVTSVLFELITARHERRSLFITANQPFGEWGKIFPGDPAMALAAADRLGRRAPLI
jgi:IstB-like ATP binding protein